MPDCQRVEIILLYYALQYTRPKLFLFFFKKTKLKEKKSSNKSYILNTWDYKGKSLKAGLN